MKILIAEDHPVVRDGLVALLRHETDMEVIASVADGEAAIEHIQRLRPDVAVADIVMPVLTGIELARKVREMGLKTKVVLLSAHNEPSFVRNALAAGAAGYVLKDCATTGFLEAVRAAAVGKVYLSPKVSGAIASMVAAAPRDPEAAELSPRERDVLRCLARGLSSKEIGTRLHISVRTVEAHRRAITHKLDIHSIPELVKYALRHQLATLED